MIERSRSTRAAMVRNRPWRRLSTCLALLVCTAGSPAQAQAPAQAKAQRDPVILRLIGLEEPALAQLAGHLGLALPEAPALRAGQRLELQVRAAAGAALQGVAGSRDLRLDLDLDPGALCTLLGRRNPRLGRLLTGLSQSFLTLKCELEPRYCYRLLRAVRGLPEQFVRLRLRIRQQARGKALQAELELDARPGSFAAAVLGGIEAQPRGSFILRDPRASLSVACAVKGPGLERLLRAGVTHLAQVRGRNRAERAAFAAAASRRLAHFDGSFGLLIPAPGAYLRLVGLRDPEAFARLSAMPTLDRFDRARMGSRPLLREREELPAALQARGLSCLVSEQEFYGNAAADPQGLGTFTGVVRDTSIKFRLPRNGQACQRQVERLESRLLRRFPLPEGALFQVQLRLPKQRELRQRLEAQYGSELADNPLLKKLGLDASLLEAIPAEIHIRGWRRGSDARPGLRIRISGRD